MQTTEGDRVLLHHRVGIISLKDSSHGCLAIVHRNANLGLATFILKALNFALNCLHLFIGLDELFRLGLKDLLDGVLAV